MSDSYPDDSWTLGDVKEWFIRRVDDGLVCPCCMQHGQRYKRKIYSANARALIKIYLNSPVVDGERQFVHATKVVGNGQAARGRGTNLEWLRWWGEDGLLQHELERREDGGRSGWWRVTGDGERFVRGLTRYPKFARVYAGQLFGLEGPEVSIQDALGAKFDYAALMRGEW